MHILLIGLNHKVAPVEVREAVAFTAEQAPAALARLREAYPEAVILSTCNRTEIYVAGPADVVAANTVVRFLATFHDVQESRLTPYFYVRHDREAIRHLFAVACGLDSMIVGEPQVLGQVVAAYEQALAAGAAGSVLSALFRQAITTGKRARTETGISRNAASVSFAAVELARQIFGGLNGRRILIVGAGETGELTAKTLLDCGAHAIIVANRTRTRAEEIARRFGGSVLDFHRLAEGLAEADIVISSTGAPHYVLHRSQVEEALLRRNGRPLFLIDIAVPRDIDPKVSDLEGVHLYDVDDLHAVVEDNLRERRRELTKVERIIAEEVARFECRLQALAVVPTISALRGQAEQVRRAELERCAPYLCELDERQWRAVEAMTGAIVNKLLHAPTQRLKTWAESGCVDADYMAVTRDLFGLPED
ncbi:MAG: glutamyl-tRNA reductase [Chloroflexota bacterium]